MYLFVHHVTLIIMHDRVNISLITSFKNAFFACQHNEGNTILLNKNILNLGHSP